MYWRVQRGRTWDEMRGSNARNQGKQLPGAFA
jgi:hypothetical protein